MKYDIAIAHRISPGIAKTAVGFHDKFDMVKETVQSLYNALGNIKAKVFVILDGCPLAYDQILRPRTKKDNLDIEIIRTNAIGNLATFSLQIDILSKVTDADFVYFSEDDYLYRSDAFEIMMGAMSQESIDFITPLDHPDSYLYRPLGISHKILFCNGIHWRTAASTCLTFLTRPKTLHQTKDVLSLYSHGCLDASVWLGLTSNFLHNPITLAWHLFKSVVHPSSEKINNILRENLAQHAVKYLNAKLLSVKHYNLYSPIPTLAVHLCNLSLPPGASKFFDDELLRAEIHKTESEYLLSKRFK